jgi:hypothetical protein
MSPVGHAAHVAGAAALLAPIGFRALAPPGLVEADGRDATATVPVEWFPPGRVEALEPWPILPSP